MAIHNTELTYSHGLNRQPQTRTHNSYNVVNATDMASSYVTALYFTTSSLTSVGFGNVSGECVEGNIWPLHLARATPKFPHLRMKLTE